MSLPNRQSSPSSVAFLRGFVVKPDVRPHPVHTPRTSEESGEAPPPLGSEFRSSPSVLTGEAPAPQAVSRPFEAVKTSKAPGNNDKRRAHVSPGQRHNSPPDLPHRVWRTKTSNPRVGGSSPSGRALGPNELSAPKECATIVAMVSEPLRTVRDHLSEFVERVERQHERIVITRNGRAAAILVSPEDLAALEETLELLSDPVALRELREAEEALAEGDVVRGVDQVRLLRDQ